MLNYKIKFILNFGMAGGHGTQIHRGDLFVATECINGNSYITKRTGKGGGISFENINFQSFVDGPNADLIIEKVDNNIINKIKNIKSDNKVYYGKIYSSEQWNKEYDKIMFLNEKYNTQCEDMEAYAIFLLCNRYKIPFAVIKGISHNENLNEEYNCEVLNDLVIFVRQIIKSLDN